MARGLNVITIAEFVENRETVDILRGLEVELGQGYHFGRPDPAFIDEGKVRL